MLEIGIGHNWDTRSREEQKPCRQLEESAKSILDIPPAELARRRKAEALDLLRPRAGKGVGNKHGVKVYDHHKRFDVSGKRRCLLGTADDFTTVAPHDDLANHLYIADDPNLRHEMMEYRSDDEEPDVGEETDVVMETGGLTYSTEWSRNMKERTGLEK